MLLISYHWNLQIKNESIDAGSMCIAQRDYTTLQQKNHNAQRLNIAESKHIKILNTLTHTRHDFC